ncbi:unnamed protein product [Albugo candida]|uniref:Protein YIPF n=1 Tax=Albugo candida TaxID=65357 RepID=A0A024FZC4_9STRA|nr:unnamed protein product [Albugo candida]|eukprot:CCI39924.1 unnamed protein product [Albugo candida]
MKDHQDVKNAAHALNDRGSGLDFEVTVEGDSYEEGVISQNVRNKLMGKENDKGVNKICGCFTLAYYQPYFDVDTSDVQQRISRAILPLKKNPHFTEIIGTSPDAYGPFWLSTTLIFMLASCSNGAGYLDFQGDKDEWTYDFSRLATAYTLVVSFVLGVPVLTWGAVRYFGATLSLTYLVCLYGYSTTLYIPASFLCMLPEDASDWIVLLFTMTWSLFFLLNNFCNAIRGQLSNEKMLPFFAMISAVHLMWTIMLKLLFF